MTDGVIKNLKLTHEYLAVLRGMVRKEQDRVRNELEYVAKAIETVDETIYQLTGDIFYRNKSMEEKNETRGTDGFPA